MSDSTSASPSDRQIHPPANAALAARQRRSPMTTATASAVMVSFPTACPRKKSSDPNASQRNNPESTSVPTTLLATTAPGHGEPLPRERHASTNPDCEGCSDLAGQPRPPILAHSLPSPDIPSPRAASRPSSLPRACSDSESRARRLSRSASTLPNSLSRRFRSSSSISLRTLSTSRTRLTSASAASARPARFPPGTQGRGHGQLGCNRTSGRSGIPMARSVRLRR